MINITITNQLLLLLVAYYY